MESPEACSSTKAAPRRGDGAAVPGGVPVASSLAAGRLNYVDACEGQTKEEGDSYN